MKEFKIDITIDKYKYNNDIVKSLLNEIILQNNLDINKFDIKTNVEHNYKYIDKVLINFIFNLKEVI